MKRRTFLKLFLGSTAAPSKVFAVPRSPPTASKTRRAGGPEPTLGSAAIELAGNWGKSPKRAAKGGDPARQGSLP